MIIGLFLIVAFIFALIMALKELNERLAIIRQNNERELQLKIDENKLLGETVEKLLNRIDDKDKRINELIGYIQKTQDDGK